MSLEEAVSRLKSGELVAFPTETFYGLAAIPSNQQALERLCKIKTRGLGQGFPCIVDSAERVEEMIADETEEAQRLRLRLQQQFWPGPLSLVIAVKDEEDFVPGVLGPKNSLALRISSSELAQELASMAGGILTATSANPHGQAPAENSETVRSYFPDMHCLEASSSDCQGSQPSTLLDLRVFPPKILREGAILETVLNEVIDGL